MALAAVVVGQAGAATSAPASMQVSLRAAPDVLSVTVTPGSGTFGGCQGGDSLSPGELGFPNGRCSVGGITVTNTGLPAHIMVNGSAFAPVGGGMPWTMCGSPFNGPSCQGPTNPQGGNDPGPDQYGLQTKQNVVNSPALATQPQCDRAFRPDCAAAPRGQSATEQLLLTGPQSTENGAGQYTSTVTWTVVAP